MEKVQIANIYSAEQKVSKASGKTFFLVRFRDAVTARDMTMFAWQQEDIPKVGDTLEGTVTTGDYNGKPNYTFEKPKSQSTGSRSSGSSGGSISEDAIAFMIAAPFMAAQAATGKITAAQVTFEHLSILQGKIKEKLASMKSVSVSAQPSVSSTNVSSQYPTATPAYTPPAVYTPPVIPQHVDVPSHITYDDVSDIPF
jgi:hypothetical protein